MEFSRSLLCIVQERIRRNTLAEDSFSLALWQFLSFGARRKPLPVCESFEKCGREQTANRLHHHLVCRDRERAHSKHRQGRHRQSSSSSNSAPASASACREGGIDFPRRLVFFAVYLLEHQRELLMPILVLRRRRRRQRWAQVHLGVSAPEQNARSGSAR